MERRDLAGYCKFDVYSNDTSFARKVLRHQQFRERDSFVQVSNKIKQCFDNAVFNPPDNIEEDKIMAINVAGGRMFISECYRQGWLYSGIFGAVGMLLLGSQTGSHYCRYERICVSPSYREFYKNSMAIIDDQRIPIERRYMFALLLPNLYQENKEGAMHTAFKLSGERSLSYGRYITSP